MMAQPDGVPNPTPEMLRLRRRTIARMAALVPLPDPAPNRTVLDGLHAKCISAAISLGVCVALNNASGKKAAIQQLNEAEFAYSSAMDRAVPVGGQS